MFANAIMYNLPGTPTAKDATEVSRKSTIILSQAYRANLSCRRVHGAQMMELVEQKLLGHRETERLVKQNSKASK